MNNRIEEQLQLLRPYSMVIESGETLYTLTETDLTTALHTIAEEARREELERIEKSFYHWFKKGTEDVEDWAERVLTTANNK